MRPLVLGLGASPRAGGNTEALVQRALDAAQARGAEAVLVRLSSLALEDCDACLGCKREGRCHRSDPMAGLLDQLRRARALVVGTPILMNQASALLKRFSERTLPFQRPDFTPSIDLPTLLVVTQSYEADPDLDAYLPVLARGLGRTGMRVTATVREMGLWERGQAADRGATHRQIEAWVADQLTGA